MLFFALILALLFIILSAVLYKLHPFLSLLGGAIIFALCSGMELKLLVESINQGFGSLMGNIGLIILFGVMIGTFLERSGGALILANKILNWIGDRFVTLAMMITGYIISIPVFADSGFVIMSPLNKALSKKASVPIAGTTAALAIGLLASHVMVPPTPGPVAAAAFLDASIGQVMIWGLVVSSVTCLFCYLIIINFVSKISIASANDVAEVNVKNEKSHQYYNELLHPGKALLPILLPILLIVLGTVGDMDAKYFGEGTFYNWISFFGQPVIALLIGLLVSFTLPKNIDRDLLSGSGWIGDAFKAAAPILLITGAGGIFGQVLKNSELGDLISGLFDGSSLGLLIPFLLAAALKTCQGSSTVALLTTASIMSSLMVDLGLDSEWMTTLTVLSIAAGSAVVSHVNDSFFWVLTQMTGFSVSEGYKVQTVMTGVFGLIAMTLILILSALG